MGVEETQTPLETEHTSDADGTSLDHLDKPVTPDAEKPYEAAVKAEAQPTGPPPVSNAPPAGGPSPPPNGGLAAWLQVVGGWCLFFDSWGLLNTFGVYQTYYESGALFVASSSDISWIGAIQALMVLLVGAVVGPLFDRGYLRLLLISGTFLIVFGHMMLSLCHELWQVILAQGFCIGMGAGALFVPAVAILPTYFNTRLGLAVGLAASGSSMGGIIFPIMFYRLIPLVGFGWSVRILGFTVLATLLVPIAVMKMRFKPPRARALIDTSAFTDWPFVTLVLACVFGFIGLYVGIFFFSYFGASTGVTSPSLSFYLVPILNAGSVLGRTLPNYVSDKVGPLNIIAPGTFFVALVVFCNLAVHNAAGLIVTTLFFGFFSGIFIALPPVLFVAFTKDRSKIGTRIGMGFAFCGLGGLAGGPGAGAILQRRGMDPADLDWRSTWIFGGVALIAAGSILVALRIWRAGTKLMVKI